MDAPTTPPTADCASPDAARVAALHRENEARAKALDADRRGDHHAATRHRADARQAVADRLDLPDPLPDEVGRRLERLADQATLCREMERHFRGLGDHATADGWMADAAAAEADAHRLRDGVAEFVRKGLRWLAEADPAAVLTLLGFADHGERLAAVEAAVVELADGRGEAAVSLGKVRRRVNREPGGAEAGSAARPGWAPPTPFGRDADPSDFPLDVLPGWLRDMVAAVSTATQTPAAAAGMLVLAAVAGALAGLARYRVRPGFAKNANLYAVVAMLPAERKSAVFKMIFTPVYAAERRAVERAGPDIARAAAEKGVLEARLKKAQADAARVADPGERHSLTTEAKGLAGELERFGVPVTPVFVVDDDTTQMLAKTLIEQDGRLLQAAAEGTAFEIAGGRYADAEDFDVYLKAYDGNPLRVGRVGRGRQGHDNPRLTCGLAVQPDVLAGLGRSAKAAGRGFLARWLYALPAPMAGRRRIRPVPVPAAVAAEYERVLGMLWTLPPEAKGPSEVPFSREADDALAAFETRVEPLLADGGPLAGLASWGGKLCGEVARLAGTLHLAAAAGAGGLDSAGPVSAAAVAAAVRLADEFLVPHAKLAFGVMHADPVEELARRLLSWLARRPDPAARFTRNEAFQGLKGGGSALKADDLVPAFVLLAELGYLRLAGPTGGPGRPSENWDVNSLWLRTVANPPPNPPKPEPARVETGDSGEGVADHDRHPTGVWSYGNDPREGCE